MANEVYSNILKQVIDVDKFVSLENVKELEEDIYCLTKGCKAKFIYYSASETKGHHFQKFPGEEHSEFCEFKNSGTIYRNKKHSEKIKASLDSDGYDSTLNTMLSFLNTKIRPDEEKETKKRNKRKPKIKVNEDEEDGIQYNFEFTSDQSKEEQEKIQRLKENNVKLRRPSIFRKSLNQLSGKHSFSYKKTYAIIKNINQINSHAFEIIIKDMDTEKKAILVLTQAFFSGSSDVGLSDYIKMVKNYVSKENSNKLITLVVFELREFDQDDIILYANDESAFKLVIDDGKSKLIPRDLAQFAALYTTKAI